MKLKRIFTKKTSEEKIKKLGTYIFINSKKLQSDGNYLITYTMYSPGKYEVIVNQLIKQKYSDSEEFALINKGIINNQDEEYVTYRAYVEQCKEEARVFIEERKKVIGK